MQNSTQALHAVDTLFETSVGGRLLIPFVRVLRARLWFLVALLLPLLLTSIWMMVGSSAGISRETPISQTETPVQVTELAAFAHRTIERETGLAASGTVDAPPAQSEPELPREVSTDWWSQVQQNMAAREYHASTTAQGLQAPNRAHNWRIYFEPTGVEIVARTGAADPALLQLDLAAWGRADQMHPAQPGTLFSQAERVEIRRDGLVEWYRNSAQGLEHGFEIAKRPAGEGDLRFTLSATGAQVELKDDHIIFTPPAGPSLRYGKLHVYDASDEELPGRRHVHRAHLSAMHCVVAVAQCRHRL